MSIRKKFTAEEDAMLKLLIDELGSNNWQEIAKLMPNRNAKQCRDRYNNYLIETHRSGPWDIAEDSIIIQKYREIGPKWVEIALYIPGRSGNDVKNRWYKHLLKKKKNESKLGHRRLIKHDDQEYHDPEPAITMASLWNQYSINALLTCT